MFLWIVVLFSVLGKSGVEKGEFCVSFFLRIINRIVEVILVLILLFDGLRIGCLRLGIFIKWEGEI